VPWWQHTTVYQIYPRSFADGNGDGIGDLPGVLAKLDYLQALGVETLWLSPFFASPQRDFGYDVSDYYGVAPEYGSVADVARLIREVHARGMKIVFDLVLNHTSDEHPWFVASRRDRHDPKRSYYLWRAGRLPAGKAPPNNWRSMLGGSGWHYDAATGEWYFASFLPFQPDLNYRNPEVKAAMLDVVRHWLAQGVDGFRLDIFNALYKDASFADNPFSPRPIPTADNPHGFFQRHVHTIDHPDTFAFARELRAVVDGAGEPPRFVVGEVFGDARTLKRYCGADGDGLHLVFLFETLRARLAARPVRRLIAAVERAFAEPHVPTWVLGNHDRPRLMQRLGDDVDKAKLMATLQLTVRGVPFIYYGDEIGVGQLDLPRAAAKDPVAARFRFVPRWLSRRLLQHGILLNRDECRAPMAWDGGANAGFSPPDTTPWLPLHPRHHEVNVAVAERDPASLLHCYRALLRQRRERAALHAGRLELVATGLPAGVVGYRRTHLRDEVEVLLNFSPRERRLELERHRGRTLFSSRSVTRAPLSAGVRARALGRHHHRLGKMPVAWPTSIR
jgi:oligo-1,6-glucosidase/alpha-glucosidase